MPVLDDLRFSGRLFRRSPGLTAISLLSIALSIGVTAVVFAAVKAVLLDPLPYSRAGELVQFRSEYPKMNQQSSGNYAFWNDVREIGRRSRTLGPIGVNGNEVFDMAGDPHEPPEALYGVHMNAILFPVLGVSPMLGRNVLPEEDTASHSEVMILSYGLWRRRFHGDPSVVGRTVIQHGHGCLVIGVMPPGFNYPLQRSAAHTPAPYVEFWSTPFHIGPNPNGAFTAVARLRPGVTLEAARQEMASISTDLAREFPALNRDRVLKLVSVRESAVGPAGRNLVLLMAATGLFLLIGCANVANLLLARGMARQREIAVRLAIGASPGRIMRQVLTESCALAALGGIGGYLLTLAAWKVLPSVAPATISRLAAAHADMAVLAFAMALAIVNGLLFGIAPAFRMANKGEVLTAGFGVRGAASGRHDRLRSLLVAGEVALSVLLVVVGGQVLASFIRLVNTDPGFDRRVVASVVLPSPVQYRDPLKRALYYRQLVEAARSIPGVDSAGTTDALPFSGENHGGLVYAGQTSGKLTAEIDTIGAEYLQTMGIRLLEGRWFRDEDMDASNNDAIVNPSVAQRLWPGGSALGQRICVYCSPEHPDRWKRVVGVVSGARHATLDGPPIGNVYLAADAMRVSVFLVLRTARPPLEIEAALRRAIAAVDPDQPVFLSASMRELVADSVADRRFILLLLGATGSLALALAAAGVYGVISYTTSMRTQEIGIRMTVGATPGDIFSMIYGEALLTVGVGLAVGLAAAAAVMRGLRGTLFGLESVHTAAVLMACATAVAAAAIACWIPARRATRTDPLASLRVE